MSSNKKTIVKIFHDGFKQKIDIKKKKKQKNRILIRYTITLQK